MSKSRGRLLPRSGGDRGDHSDPGSARSDLAFPPVAVARRSALALAALAAVARRSALALAALAALAPLAGHRRCRGGRPPAAGGASRATLEPTAYGEERESGAAAAKAPVPSTPRCISCRTSERTTAAERTELLQPRHRLDPPPASSLHVLSHMLAPCLRTPHLLKRLPSTESLRTTARTELLQPRHLLDPPPSSTDLPCPALRPPPLPSATSRPPAAGSAARDSGAH